MNKTIKSWLENATNQLRDKNICSAKLDAEIILSKCLAKDRTYLVAHDTDILTSKNQIIADRMLKKRQKQTPIAYLINEREFYGRTFFINKDVLIPKPESEAIVDILKNIDLSNCRNLVDIGCGSGVLGISAKLELPNLNVTLVDISSKALRVASKNCQKLKANCKLIKNNLLTNIDKKFEIIVANLPYVDKKWLISEESKFEPKLALFANDKGLELIRILVNQTKSNLTSGGYLILEADPRQHDEIKKIAKDNNLNLVTKTDYILAFKLN